MKSTSMALCLVQNKINLNEAFKLSRIEEDFQANLFGKVLSMWVGRKINKFIGGRWAWSPGIPNDVGSFIKQIIFWSGWEKRMKNQILTKILRFSFYKKTLNLSFFEQYKVNNEIKALDLLRKNRWHLVESPDL